jgi:hypothetical protein
MLRVGILKTVGRVASLALLLVTTMGPWFIDSHPATEESCSHPLVWLGSGHCACLVSLMAAIREAVKPGHHLLWLLCLPPALPFLSTLLLLLSGERRWLWVCHLAAWGLVAIYSLFLFVGHWIPHPMLRLWGAGLCGVVAVAILVGEILVGKSLTLNESP